MEKIGKKEAEDIDWSNPRLLCIANDFTKFDEHAISQINRNIELLRFQYYDNNVILFELVNARTAEIEVSIYDGDGKVVKRASRTTVGEYLENADEDLRNLFESLKNFLMALGDDVQMNELKYYFAFKRLQNFASVEVHPKTKEVIAFIKVNPDTITLEPGFTRDFQKPWTLWHRRS